MGSNRAKVLHSESRGARVVYTGPDRVVIRPVCHVKPRAYTPTRHPPNWAWDLGSAIGHRENHSPAILFDECAPRWHRWRRPMRPKLSLSNFRAIETPKHPAHIHAAQRHGLRFALRPRPVG